MADKKKTITNAESRQDAADRRTQMVRDQMQKERAATDAKTARLKALRLAQEEEEAAKPKPRPALAPEKRAALERKVGRVTDPDLQDALRRLGEAIGRG